MKYTRLHFLDHIFSSITHGIGVALSIVGLIILVMYTKDDGMLRITGFIIFGASLILMYLMSTLFHGLFFTKAKKLFFIFDRSAIFLLIAGTYTPLSLLLLHGWERISLMFVIWGLAIFGIVLNAFFLKKYRKYIIPLYLLMGWIGIFLIQPLLAASSLQQVWILLLSGLLYLSGIVFYGLNKLPFNHTIWHVFVLCGSFCNFLTIYRL